jgi:uncharacterized protein YacL
MRAGFHVAAAASGPSSSERAAHQVIRGVEILLLAPLAYFVLVNLARYVQTWKSGDDDEKAKSNLLGVKALVVGLLIAMVATDLVGKILSEKGLDEQSALLECLVILVLTAYCFGLELIAARVLKTRALRQPTEPNEPTGREGIAGHTDA